MPIVLRVGNNVKLNLDSQTILLTLHQQKEEYSDLSLTSSIPNSFSRSNEIKYDVKFPHSKQLFEFGPKVSNKVS